MARLDRRYRAFVSYSHADKAAGARLFARIDGFRPPKGLIGSEGAYGPVAPKLYPCFRDREELAVSRDVKTSLDDALHNSEHLVVVCSPDAAKSAWIAHEITSFAERHGADRIHVVLASGEPEVSLPPALAEVGLQNPLAADLRTHADGWKDGPLKVIAAILGVSFGELKDREVARTRTRQRATAVMSAIFATVLLGGCGASWVALDQSEQVQRLFNDAMKRAFDEQGVTLTTSQMSAELDEARSFTRAAYRVAPDRPILLKGEMRLAIVYARHLLSIGETSKAYSEIRRLRAVCARFRSCTTDLEAKQLMGAGRRTEAAIALALRSDAQEAASLLQQSVGFLTGLADPDSRRELTLTQQALGSLAIGEQQYQRATEHYEAAAAIISELVAAGHTTRDLQHDQIVSFEALGDIAFDRDDLPRARTFYQRANQLATILAEAELDQRSERDLYVTHDRLGLIALRLDDHADAYANFEASNRFAKQLARRDPDNLGLRRDIYVSYMQLARVAAMRGDIEAARERLTDARDQALELVALDPENTDRQADLARAVIAVARLNNHLAQSGTLFEFDAEFEFNAYQLLRYAQSQGIAVPANVERALMRHPTMRMLPRPTAPACPDPRYC